MCSYAPGVLLIDLSHISRVITLELINIYIFNFGRV
jgi:hypothetical protein